MKKMIALTLAFALLLSVCAMQSFALAEDKNVIRYSISDDPQQMDPTLNSYSRSSLVLQNLFQGLYKLGPDGETYIPACAESYEVSEDGMTYTFHLKEGLMWSDGTALTAKDFEYSWKRVSDPEVASGTASDLWVIKNAQAYSNGECTADEMGVTATDDLTLVVETSYYAPWFPSLTATTAFFPVKQEVVEAEGDPWTKNVETYVSNGPFMLQEYSSLDKLVMVKNPYYYGYEDVQVDEVIYYIIADSASALVSYDNDDLNVNDELDYSGRQKYGDTNEYAIKNKIGIQYWDFNTQLPEFSDARVRQAFAMAIDRSAVLAACMLQAETPLYGFVPASQPSLTTDGYFRDVAGNLFTEDVAAAQALMSEAGYPNGEGFPVVEIVCQNSDEQKTMAQILGELWKANLGIEYTIRTLESSTYWGELANGNFSIARNGFTCDYLDPSANLRVWTTGSNCSENGWDDPVYDQMFTDASTILDPAEREAALIELEEYLVSEMPGMPVYTMVDDYLVKPYISGVIKNAVGHIFFEYAQFS